VIAAAILAGTLACTPYPPDRDSPISDCAVRRRDGELRVLPAGLKALVFDKDGVAAIVVGKEFFYVTRSGRTAVALPYDNGPDDFVEGLARTLRKGKVGYVDRRLREAIRCEWDFAFPFEDGVAVVCDGCTRVREEEHARIEGGNWGYIDRKGQVVVPVVHARDALPPKEQAVRAAYPR